MLVCSRLCDSGHNEIDSLQTVRGLQLGYAGVMDG